MNETVVKDNGTNNDTENKEAIKTEDKKEAVTTDNIVKPEKEGWDQVDFNLLPEDIRSDFQKRFNRLYHQVKKTNSERAEERKYYQRLEEKLNNIIASNTSNKQQQIELLAEQAKSHFKSENFDDGIAAIRRLVQLEKEIPLEDNKKKDKDNSDTISNKQNNKEFTDEEKLYLKSFVDRNEWAKNNSPLYERVKVTIGAFLDAGDTLHEAVDKTEELIEPLVKSFVKQKMSKKDIEDRVVSNVLGRDDSVGDVTKKENVKLTEEQKAVARKFFPKLSTEDAYKRYISGM